jgi:hypothetical protein
MSERVCVRGCVLRGRHLVSHSEAEKCNGCLPVEAMGGAMLCEACVVRLRRVLTEVPDLVAHLRSMVDPLRSGWNWDRPRLSRSRGGSKLPMNTDLIEAADQTLGILTFFADVFGDEMDYSRRRHLAAGSGAIEAYDAARMPAWYLLDNLGWIVNDIRVAGFARAVLGPSADPEDWTIARALGRWPLRDRAKFAQAPCPECKLRMVMIKPPRHAWDRKAFECLNPKCLWRPPRSEYEDWEEHFEGAVDPWVPEPRLVAAAVPVRRSASVGTTSELVLDRLQQDLRRDVCPRCWLIRPCEHDEEVA